VVAFEVLSDVRDGVRFDGGVSYVFVGREPWGVDVFVIVAGDGVHFLAPLDERTERHHRGVERDVVGGAVFVAPPVLVACEVAARDVVEVVDAFVPAPLDEGFEPALVRAAG